jgi:hypothetical protein
MSKASSCCALPFVVGALCAPLLAQGESRLGEPKFAPPVRLKAGDKFLGFNRYFPSPVLHDVNGDGLPDIVVGDLFGRLTVALRQPGAGAPVFGAETKLLAADGQPLDFHNW